MNTVKRPRKASPSLPANTAKTVKKVVIDFPEPLLRAADKVAAELQTNRSSFIRSAVEQSINQVRRRIFEEEMKAGYIANKGMDREICEDFAFVDAENL